MSGRTSHVRPFTRSPIVHARIGGNRTLDRQRHMEQSLFTSAGVFMVRAPIAPAARARRAGDIGADAFFGPLGPWADPVFREAVLVSSPSLAATAEAATAGHQLSDKDMRKALRGLKRYVLRSGTRATPFGLLAGVALGTFSDSVSATLGKEHRKRVGPRRAWLGEGLDRRIRQTGLAGFTDVRVMVNNTSFVQGAHVVVHVAQGGQVVRRKVRRTAAVDMVLCEASRPVPARHLCERLGRRFPSASEEKLWKLLEQLVALHVLVTDIRPGPETADPLAHVVERDPQWADGHRFRELFESYGKQPVGEGYSALSALYRGVGSTSSASVDLGLDADVRLPHSVAREVERAATVLWRLSDPDQPAQRALRAYHTEFLERYSQGELVPVAELLNPDSGLGAPAGYVWPAGHRILPSAAPDDPARVAVLTGLIMEAVAAGRRHVELTDELIASLAQPADELPRSAELFAMLHAPSLTAVEHSDFTLFLSPLVSPQAGASWGRFTHLLDAADTTAQAVQQAYPDGDRVLPVQLMYATHGDAGSDVAAVPRVGEHSLSVGLYDDLDAPGRVRLDDVLVGADLQGFHLYDRASGREISPYVPHLLVPEFAPNIARFLREAPTLGRRQLSGWSWKPLHRSAFLPGVRYGRTVLHLATWRLTAMDLAGRDPEEALAGWRRRWNVPDLVRLVEGDQYLLLDLRTEPDSRVLREEAAKKTVVLQEEPSPDCGPGWLRGPGGGYSAEIVVPVYPAVPAPRVRTTTLRAPRARDDAMRHLPGGSWVAQHLYCSADAQQEVLDRLAPLVRRLGEDIKTWFFIRYAEEHTGRPHLRLRFHGDPAVIARRVLPELHSWSRDLMAAGLASDCALHTYRAEVERYGGPSLIARAEDFFCADSRLALDRLARGLDTPLDVATDVVSLVRRFHKAGHGDAAVSHYADRTEDWERWFLDVFPKNERLHKRFTAVRTEALRRISFDEPPGPVSDVVEEWFAKLDEYAAAVYRAAERDGEAQSGDVLGSLVHMHCNRRLKHADDERRVYALARGVVEARVGRRRAARREARMPGPASPARTD
ncbi:lantibiotic dehydratase [Streptomyces olivaceoviridis]